MARATARATATDMASRPTTLWTECLAKDYVNKGRIGVLILNHDLPSCTERLWNQASTRVCADGGCSRIRALGIEDPPPDFVIGDLDSAMEEDLSFFENAGAKIVDLSADQDTTDLEKCFRVLLEKTDLWRREGDVLAILGGFGGRWDREMSNLNVMLRHADLDSILVGDASLARVVRPGTNDIDLNFDLEGPGCALIPLCGPCRVTTTGLRWNLRDRKTVFGELVSTSNEAVERRVTVETDVPLVWTTDSNL